MQLYHELTETSYIIIVAGSLDGQHSGEMDLTLQKAFLSDKPQIIIDCSQLQYISSAGIGIFLSNLPAVKDHQKKLYFYGMIPKVRKIIEVLGLEDVFVLLDTLIEPEKIGSN